MIKKSAYPRDSVRLGGEDGQNVDGSHFEVSDVDVGVWLEAYADECAGKWRG